MRKPHLSPCFFQPGCSCCAQADALGPLHMGATCNGSDAQPRIVVLCCAAPQQVLKPALASTAAGAPVAEGGIVIKKKTGKRLLSTLWADSEPIDEGAGAKALLAEGEARVAELKAQQAAAVESEDFALAGELKKQIGEAKVAALEAAKAAAVAAEQFVLAGELKEKIATLQAAN